jgi:excisionase family DNA binding protein
MLTTDQPLTCSVPEAGRMLGLARDAAYAAARNGQIPTLRLGKLLRVPIAALERMVAEAGTKSAAA